MNDPNATGFVTEEDKTEVAELEKMGAVAAEEQLLPLAAAQRAVTDWEKLERRRVQLSGEFDVHQTQVYNGYEGFMSEARMKTAADELERLGKQLRTLESRHPDLKTPHGRILMTAPDLIEAGIAKPAGDGLYPEEAPTNPGELDDYLEGRYGFDQNEAAKDEPSRPKTVPVGMESTEDPDRQTTEAPEDRTEDELWQNELAARKVVQDASSSPLPNVSIPVGTTVRIPPEHLPRRHAEPPNPFAEARAFMKERFDADHDFLDTYVANVAMLLYDRFQGADWTNPSVRNEAARDILQRIFWD